MGKFEGTEKQGISIVRQSGWVVGRDIDLALYLVPLFQDRCYRITSEFGSYPWAICSLDNGAFFLLPCIEEDGDPHFIQTDF